MQLALVAFEGSFGRASDGPPLDGHRRAILELNSAVGRGILS